MLAPGQADRGAVTGALSASYEVPSVHLHHNRHPLLVAAAFIITGYLLFRHGYMLLAHALTPVAAIVSAACYTFMTAQWLVSLLDREIEASPRQQRLLDRLHVSVVIPCYNEDAEILDRTIYALMTQTRLPQVIVIVDDGSRKADYTKLRQHWEGRHESGVTIYWIRKPNGGKRSAQLAAFRAHPGTDVWVTIDSDTALESRCIDLGLQPFKDARVTSVATVELAFNSHKNWLTRTVSSRAATFQVISCAVQGLCGYVYVNRGACGIYRAGVIRRFIPAYENETFLGHRIELGDDGALTLYASLMGRTVQQTSAFALTMYPEKLSHHFRQWIRWGRGSATRNIWRIRYLPLYSYVWWYVAIGLNSVIIGPAVPVIIVLSWPESGRFLLHMLPVMLGWSYLVGLRMMAIRRSDQSFFDRVGNVLVFPAALLWGQFVLRPLRTVGTLTWQKQGWTTRAKVENFAERGTREAKIAVAS